MIGLTHFTKLREGYGKIIGHIYAQEIDWSNLFQDEDLDFSLLNMNEWNTSSVTNMRSMFRDTPFNQDIGSWDTGSVTNMGFMFYNTPFNQDIGSWDTGSVTDMVFMFYNTPFNQDIGSWDTGSVTDMYSMFRDTPFNQDIGSWDTGSVTNMGYMFKNSLFNQDISWSSANPNQWRVDSVTTFQDFLISNTAFSNANYDKFLIGLKAQDDAGYTLESGVQLDAPNQQYGADPDAVTAHDFLVNTRNWTINDAGQVV